MHLKEGFILRKLGGQYVVAATGELSSQFNGLIKLNSTGAFLWEVLSEGSEEAELVSALCAAYAIQEEVARQDTRAFITTLQDAGVMV